MLAGLFFYQKFRPKYLDGIGDPPAERPPAAQLLPRMLGWIAGIAAAGGVGYWGFITAQAHNLLPLFWVVVVGLGLVIIVGFVMAQRPHERGPLAVIFILSLLGNILFWAAFEQAGSSMNVFAERSTDRTLGGWLAGDGFPASWYQSVNPAAILIFAPVFAWLWVRLDRRRMNPSTPMKFALGLYLLGLAFLGMVFGAWEARDNGLAGPHWLLITYVAYTWGELCLSPVGLSMVTKLAPERLQSLMMGVWFFSFSLANLLSGLLAAYSKKLESGEATFVLDGLPGFYLMLVVFPFMHCCDRSRQPRRRHHSARGSNPIACGPRLEVQRLRRPRDPRRISRGLAWTNSR
jgi:POT family proton-dependent oligopeptide transporter